MRAVDHDHDLKMAEALGSHDPAVAAAAGRITSLNEATGSCVASRGSEGAQWGRQTVAPLVRRAQDPSASNSTLRLPRPGSTVCLGLAPVLHAVLDLRLGDLPQGDASRLPLSALDARRGAPVDLARALGRQHHHSRYRFEILLSAFSSDGNAISSLPPWGDTPLRNAFPS